MSAAPTDMGVLEANRRPLLFHASALAIVLATLSVGSGQWKEMLRFVTDSARQMILHRRKVPTQ